MRWIIFIIFYILVDIYAYQAFRTFTRDKWLTIIYIAISVILLGAFIYQLSLADSSRTMTPGKMYTFGLMLAIFAPKLLIVFVMLGEDMVRVLLASVKRITGLNDGFYMPSRRRFVSSVALVVAGVPFSSLLYGMFRGKYNYQVKDYTMEFDDLPEAFDGFTITQISDIHSGSFDNREKVAYGVDLINQQGSDLILFTGDLVNNVADEMEPWTDLFGQLKAPRGVFSVLGNHDYGDYISWESEEAKKQNLDKLKDMQRQMGWNLLLNENRIIEKDGSRISLIGVENWGAGGFKKAGNLDRACEGVADDDFKILMSHDPSHWAQKVQQDSRHFHLTLSGHTHGMQFGVEIPGLVKWSPVKYRYEQWAGIYEASGEFINVNRGFGFIGYPGRVGIWPEISVITLKKRRRAA